MSAYPPEVIKIENLKKKYRLGQIGGGTLTADLQSWWARVRGKEDPNTTIGTDTRLIGTEFMALNGVDLTVYKGEAVGIIGANGAGKSTLLKLLSQITAPTEGEIRIRGRIASMLEVGTGFNGEMTGRENIYMNGAILGMSKAEIDSKIEEIIAFSECGEFIDTPVKRYSSGMFVKLAFAVASHLDSEILIMDEVLAVGDVAFQRKCLEKMSQLSTGEGRTILYVSHNMSTIRQLCTRCIVLREGRVTFDGEVEGAIEEYLGKPGESLGFYNLREVVREGGMDLGKRLRIHSLEMAGDPPGAYEDGQPLRFCLKWALNENLEGIQFRCLIKYADATTIGVSAPVQKFNLPAGEYVTGHEMDLSALPKGQYWFMISFYLTDEFNHEVVLDSLLNYFPFEKTTDNPARVEWNHRSWGHVWLDTVTTTFEEK